MRYRGQSRGKTPTTCQSCRDERPGQHWCDPHGRWHPVSRFTPKPRRSAGYLNTCTEAQSIKLSESRGYGPIICAACKELKPSHRFRGGRAKAVACKECEATHLGQRWCPDHAEWLPVDRFVATGSGGRFQSVRCIPCRTAAGHGVTVTELLARQGIEAPECAVCGSTDRLNIDHDHGHCPGPVGCAKCVRAYLCSACNTAEGMLKTPQRARALADYMERHAPA